MLHKVSIIRNLIILFAVFFSVAIMMLSASAADDNAVFHAVLNSDKGFLYTVDAYYDGVAYHLYLPSAADTSSLDLLYTGKGSISYDDTIYSSGETLTVDASSGNVSIGKAGGQLNVEVATGGRIPSVYIDLSGGDEAFRAVCADKNHYESGKISMLGENGSVIYNGELEKFKGHGLTSFIPSGDTNYKNSYNIKLGEKSELIPGAGSIKKWVLLSPRMYDGSRDPTGLSQLLAFHTYNGFIGEKLFSIKGEYVDLYVNGDYRGVYILCERMNDGGAIEVTDLDKFITGEGNLTTVTESKDADDPATERGIRQYTYCEDAELNAESADITGGYVLEVMCDVYENCGFVTEHGVFFSIKSPEICTQEMVRYIASYVQSFENAIFSETGYNKEGHHYTEYADIESLADMMLVYAFFDNFEFFRTSTYICKDADGTSRDRLTFGPVWDFETAAADLSGDKTLFGTANWLTYFVKQQYIWAEQLWQHGDFMTVMCRENEKMRSALDDVILCADDIISDASASQAMSTARWNIGKYTRNAKAYIAAVRSRYSEWYDKLWGDDYLMFLDVSAVMNGDGMITMTAKTGGTADGQCAWYVISADDHTKYTLYSNRGNTITVPADGKQYFCSLSGGNNAFFEYAAGEIFSSRSITMYSAPVTADAGSHAPPETDKVTEKADDIPAKGCISSVGVPSIVVALFPSLAILKKKKNKINIKGEKNGK